MPEAPRAQPRIAALGDESLLDERVFARLDTRFPTARLCPAELARVPESDLIVSVARPGSADWHVELRTAAVANGVPWLWVRLAHRRALVGVAGGDGEAGCPTCVLRRAERALKDAPRVRFARQRSGAEPPGFAYTVLAADVVAELVAAVAGDPVPGNTVHQIDLATLAVSRHRFLADPTCPDCGELPADTESSARIALVPRRKTAPDSFRLRDIAELDTTLRETYVDEALGVVRELDAPHEVPLPRSVAMLSSLRDNDSHHGWGRTFDVGSAHLIAVLEALERVAGEQPGGRRTVVEGSYRELRDRALDPRRLGLYPDSRYGDEEFRFLRYTEDLVVPWVWGHSFARDEPVLVPERYAYYAVHSRDDPRFVYEVSNGCALGSCLEEGILSGLLEVAERDAFLMTWYARMAVPRIDIDSAADRTIPLMVEHLRREFDYEIRLFDTTLEQGIPCFWAMALDRSPSPDRPRVLCAGGSALVPERGAVALLHEITHLLDLVNRYDDEARERAAAMVADPFEVKFMDDHPLLYCHEDAFGRFDFLLSQQESRTFGDLAASAAWPASPDLRDDVAELIRRYADSGLEVIVVDQTTPEHRAGGLRCVKAIVPGTLPMTFGHANRRVDGLPRLLTVPHRLGYRDSPLRPEDVSIHPHPFP